MKKYNKPLIDEEIVEIEDIIAESNNDVYDVNEPADETDPNF